MKRFFNLILFLLISFQVYAQIGEWKTYTSKNDVKSIDIRNELLWSATSGGVFSYNLSDKIFNEFSTLNGLKTTDITSIFIDSSGDIWIGAQNGYIHNIIKQKRWVYYNDIFFTTAIEKNINGFYQYKDTMYVLSAIGLHILLMNKEQFSDSYIKFGTSLQISGKVNSVLIYNDTIWVATQNGIACAPRSHPNLTAPQSWVVFTTIKGLPSNDVRTILNYQNSLYAATSNGIAKYFNGNWTTVAGTSGKKIVSMQIYDDAIFFITENELWKFQANNLILLDNSIPSKLKSLKINNNGIFIGTEEKGIIFLQDTTKISILPNCPPTNNLIGLAVDENGTLWAGTGTANGKGFLKFDGKSWYQYNFPEYPILRSPNYYKINIGKNNLKWISGWGPGLALVGSDDRILKVYNATNGLPSSVITDHQFVVPSGAVTDAEGKVWISIFNERRDTVIAILNLDSSFNYIISPFPFIAVGITMDYNGTKWLWTGRNGGGIFFYNEKDTIRGMQSGTRWGRVTKSNGLNSDNVSVITVDKDGELWIGTMDAGINIIYDPSNPLNRIAVYSPLRGQKINDILVDPLNQKWVATSLGVYVLNPDGTTILQQYTFENTGGKLLDNNVISLAMNKNDGTIYFGTEKGLSILKTYSVTPVQKYDELKISPTPFLINSHKQVVIDGLMENSSIKILTSSGELIKDLQTPGGRVASWDGTDINGNKVSTGIYIIVASTPDGNKVGFGKIVVIK